MKMDEKFMETPKAPEYVGKPLSGILSGADFPVRTSQPCCAYSCCPLLFLPLPYPTSTETKKKKPAMSKVYYPVSTATLYLVWLYIPARSIWAYQNIRTYWKTRDMLTGIKSTRYIKGESTNPLVAPWHGCRENTAWT